MILTLAEVAKLLKAEMLTGEPVSDVNIRTALAADLLSDVLASPRDETILLTTLTNLQVVRTAELIDIRAVVLVRGKRLDEEALRLAREISLPVLTTAYGLFEASGILYQFGLRV